MIITLIKLWTIIIIINKYQQKWSNIIYQILGRKLIMIAILLKFATEKIQKVICCRSGFRVQGSGFGRWEMTPGGWSHRQDNITGRRIGWFGESSQSIDYTSQNLCSSSHLPVWGRRGEGRRGEGRKGGEVRGEEKERRQKERHVIHHNYYYIRKAELNIHWLFSLTCISIMHKWRSMAAQVYMTVLTLQVQLLQPL